MSEQPRIFVGTMYTHEGDFQDSLKMIHEQIGVSVTHIIISGLREKEAHNALWHAWNDQKSGHDLFVKVDADTVLRSRVTLEDIWQQFKANPRLTGLQAHLHDYMTDGLIYGLNCFSPKVVFNDTSDELYCDRVDTGHDIVVRGDELPSNLKPAGFHCHKASEVQAFHFGIHRALKGQTLALDHVRKAWENDDRDRIRAFALIGARLSYRFAKDRKFSYADDQFKQLFEHVQLTFNEHLDLIEPGVDHGMR